MSVFFTGIISGNMLSVVRMREDEKILIGSEVRGCGVADDTMISQQISGTEGGPGLYWITKIQTVSSTTMESCIPSHNRGLMPQNER